MDMAAASTHCLRSFSSCWFSSVDRSDARSRMRSISTRPASLRVTATAASWPFERRSSMVSPSSRSFSWRRSSICSTRRRCTALSSVSSLRRAMLRSMAPRDRL
ncbi:hypothetical protein D3C72_1924020 [compost metagenome]